MQFTYLGVNILHELLHGTHKRRQMRSLSDTAFATSCCQCQDFVDDPCCWLCRAGQYSLSFLEELAVGRSRVCRACRPAYAILLPPAILIVVDDATVGSQVRLR
jgi:hypothetical protein